MLPGDLGTGRSATARPRDGRRRRRRRPSVTGVGARAAAGASKSATATRARSRFGSKATMVAVEAATVVADRRSVRSLARHHVGVGDDQAVVHHEAGAVLHPVAGRPLDLDDRPGHRRGGLEREPAGLGRRAQVGRGPEGVEHVGEVVVARPAPVAPAWRRAGAGRSSSIVWADPRGRRPGGRATRAGDQDRQHQPHRATTRPTSPATAPATRSAAPTDAVDRGRGRSRPPTTKPRAWPSEAPTSSRPTVSTSTRPWLVGVEPVEERRQQPHGDHQTRGPARSRRRPG